MQYERIHRTRRQKTQRQKNVVPLLRGAAVKKVRIVVDVFLLNDYRSVTDAQVNVSANARSL